VAVINSNQGYDYWHSITITENADAIYVGQDFDLLSPALVDSLSTITFPVSDNFNSSSGLDRFFQMIYLRHPTIGYDALLNADNLTNMANGVWQTFTAIWFSNTQRIPISDSDSSHIMAHISGMERRMTVSARTIWTMQGLLGVLILCVAICAYLNRGADRILYQPPYTIASLICLVEGSKLPRVVQQAYEDLPEGEVMTERRLKKVLENYTVRFGWFDQEDGKERYGVEIFPKDDEAM
jgi:hypothetical protein